MSEKWGILLSQLVKLTKQGDIEWSMSTDEADINADIGDFRVKIEHTPFYSQYEVQVFDTNGKILDKFTDDDLTGSGFPNAYSEFEVLFGYIRRVNSGAERALEDVLNVLKKKDSLHEPF